MSATARKRGPREPEMLTLVTPTRRIRVRVRQWCAEHVVTTFGRFSRKTGRWDVSPSYYLEEFRR